MLKNLDFKTFLVAVIFSMLLSVIVIAAISTSLIKEMKNQINIVPEKRTPESVPISEILKQGTEGETQNNGDAVPHRILTPVIFNTTGTILEVKSDRLIVTGDGSNFADNISRDLNVVFASETITVVSQDQKIKYQGLEGLKHLQKGMKILIGGNENIRGKIEFIARAINILQ